MNLTVFKKAPFYILFFLLVVVAVYFYVNHTTAVEDGVRIDSSKVFEKHEEPKNIGTNQSFNNDSQVANEVAKSSEDIVWKATPEQIVEVRKWRESRGWYDTSQANQDDYKSYSRDMLKQLADAGDLKALHLLSKGVLDVSERKALLTKAIMYGSTYAIVIMKIVETPSYNLNGQEPTDEERRKDVINAAVYPALAKMRGEIDHTPESEFAELEEEYSVQLTEEDRQLIQEKAEKLYADLESQREQLGLGKFDNTVPPLAQAFYKSQGILK